MKSKDHAFTIVELLVVVSILAILGGLLLRSLDSIRDRAKVIKCLSNLRGIGNSLQIYATENDGHLPSLTDDNVNIGGGGGRGGVDIRFVLVQYDNVFWNMVCPADPRQKTDPTPENPTYLSYIYPPQYGPDLAELEVPMCIVRDGSYYHGRRGRWQSTVLFSDNHCEVEKW